jgi:hypothetical protein
MFKKKRRDTPVGVENQYGDTKTRRRLHPVFKSLLTNKVLRFALVFAVIGSIFLYRNYALDPYGHVLTGGDELVMRYDLPMSHGLIENEFSQGSPPAMLLYGNGLMLCLDHTNAHANPQVSALMSLKQRQLSKAEVQAYFDQVRVLGYDQLVTRSLPNGVAPPVGATASMSLVTSAGERRVTLQNNEQSDTFTAITNYINDECKKAKDDFAPDDIVLESIKLSETAEAQTESIPALEVPVAEGLNEVKSSRIVGDNAKKIKELIGKGNKLYKAEDGKKIKVRAVPQIPEYKIPKMVTEDKPSGNTVSAQSTRKVKFLYVVAADNATPSNATSQINDLAATLPVYYNSQVGTTFTVEGVSVVRGNMTAGQYTTCPSDANCNGRPSLATYYNLTREFKQAGYSLIIIYSWSVEQCVGWGGPVGTSDNINVADYGVGAFSGTQCYWNGAKELLGAHEGGHSFGLYHTTDQTIMSGSYTIPNGYSWPLNASQANLLRTTSPWFNGPAIATSAPNPIASGTTFVSVSPARLLDTRPGNSTTDGQYAGIGWRQGGTVTEVQVAGRAGIPGDALAAALNITAINPQGNGYIAVYPCGIPIPSTSNINFTSGAIISNMVISKLGGGKICIYTNVTSDIVIDVNGAFPAVSTASYTNINPSRIFETRTGNSTTDGQYNGVGRLAPGSVTQLQIGGRMGIPSDVSAASLNIVAISPSSDGYLVVYPCEAGVPPTTTVSYRAGGFISNATIAKVTGGRVCIYSTGSVDIAIDVNGVFNNVTSLKSVSPSRLLDSRPGYGTVDGQYSGMGTRPGGSVTEVQVVGRAGIPADAIAAVINVTAVAPQAPGYMVAYPCGTSVPETSNVNYATAGTVISNTVLVKLGSGKVCIFTRSSSDMIVDVNGVFTAADTNQSALALLTPITSPALPPAQTCPTGYTGTYPNCVAPVCPAGYSGTYPNCVAPSCPSGYTGTYPNCVAPVKPKCWDTTIYRDANFTGVSQVVPLGQYNHPLQLGNDMISSVKVSASCEVVLYQHANFTGATQVLRRSWAGSATDPWNDLASSVIVREKAILNAYSPLYCPANGVTLYKDANFTGTAVTLVNASHDSNRLISVGIGDNTVSSVRVKPGCKVTLWQNGNYTGGQKVLHGDWNGNNLGDPWNDNTSSIHISNFGYEALDSTQLIKNGSFEAGTANWYISHPAGGRLTSSFRNDGAQSGAYYFQGTSSPYGGVLFQPVPVTAPAVASKYRLTAWVKSPICTTAFSGHLTLLSLWISRSSAYTPFIARSCVWIPVTTNYIVTNPNDTEFRAQIPFNTANVPLNVDNVMLNKVKFFENL